MHTPNFLNLIKDHKVTKRYAYMALSMLLSAIAYNLFILPMNLVAGGASGVAVLTNTIFGIDPSIMIFIINFACLIFSYIYLSDEDTLGALFVTIVYPLMVTATKDIGGIFLIDTSNKLLICIYAAIIGGITSGMIYQVGLNSGGLGIISRILYKYKHISQSKSSTIINLVIVVIGALTYGINMVLYAAIYLYISQVISEKVFLGISQNKIFYIISKKPKEIVEIIQDELSHDATIYDTMGSFFKKNNKMIMTVVPTREHFILKEYVKAIDKNAFIFVTDNYESRKQDIKIKSVK